MVCGEVADGFGQPCGLTGIEAADVDDGVKGAKVLDLLVGHGGDAGSGLQGLGVGLGRAVAAAVEDDGVHGVTSFVWARVMRSRAPAISPG